MINTMSLICRECRKTSHVYKNKICYEKAKAKGGYLCPRCIRIKYQVTDIAKNWRDNGGIAILRQKGIEAVGFTVEEHKRYLIDKARAKEQQRLERKQESDRRKELARQIREQAKKEFQQQQIQERYSNADEQWKVIPSFPNYEASTLGRFRNVVTLKLIAGSVSQHTHGYQHIGLTRDGRQYTKLGHRLIAETWIDNPNNKPMVNHKNHSRSDNRVANLEWVNESENIKASVKYYLQ